MDIDRKSGLHLTRCNYKTVKEINEFHVWTSPVVSAYVDSCFKSL